LKQGDGQTACAQRRIAPITGARIETIRALIGMAQAGESPPSRGRGLKHPPSDSVRLGIAIAPITGARIETRPGVKWGNRSGHRPHHGGAD